jgi:adenylyltransferase/sulfurtransferase
VNSGLPELTQSEQTRYSRHIILPEVGEEGQRRLKGARVLIVGAGGLGCPAALYLGAAGVGTIGIVDFDNIDLTNLQRQVLHSTSAVGTSKCQSVKQRIADLNPDVTVNVHEQSLSSQNISAILSGYDIVLDATDNFSTRYLINDACVLNKKPDVYGAIYRFEGQVSVFAAPSGPCYRCLFPDPPPPEAVPNCAEGGVLGVLAGAVGVLQATEVIKLILGLGNTLVGRLFLYDALDMDFRTLDIKRNPACPICGDKPTITTLSDTNFQCITSAPANSPEPVGITAKQLKQLMDQGAKFCLLDVRTVQENRLCALPGNKLVPVGEVESRLDELDPQQEIIVYCKSGGRSTSAAKVLISHGFKHVRNLEGGILSWIKEVDPSLPSY